MRVVSWERRKAFVIISSLCVESWSASSRLTSVPWCYHLPLLEDNTQQCRLAELGKKFQLIRSLVGKSFNLISQRRRLHVPHWSMSEFRVLRDCGTGLPRLDRDSYWVHSSLGSDKGLRASDESDNGSCPWLCPIEFGFANGMKGTKVSEGRAWKDGFN